ncbi:NUDIX hydrolase [Pseudoflavonifractor capillosus]|uniref:NUDIX hydrolase n=2 Tax=Oscillospiraceae TaxID=216572 RepID=A0A921MMD7_9FIRM|nr:NUDIX hydrolase [Pseudoflavonifractor capillosus]HJB57555.1 NUDIX hydrolase [Candidatus Flavonifractor intestinipullorum]HJG87074.1 NUDIX hydrolase [Pseudoflavonifractor capillosus]
MYWDEIAAYRPRSEQEEADQRQMLDYIRQFPDTILTRDNPIAHFSSSGFVVNADASRVLMAHHNLYRVWAWTGGHVDGEEDFLAVALREAREETGVTHIRPLSDAIASLEILPVWGHVKRGRYVPSHLHLNVSYLLLADENDPLSVREGENTRVGWLPAAELLSYTNEWEMDGVYTKLLERARNLLYGGRRETGARKLNRTGV